MVEMKIEAVLEFLIEKLLGYDNISGDVYNMIFERNFTEPVMIGLSKHFPDIDFHFVYADEDASYNTGEGYLRNGEFTQQYYPEGGSKDAWTLYLLTHEWASDELELQEDGTYRWKED